MKKYGLILFTFLLAAPAFVRATEQGETTFSCVEKLERYEWREHLDEIEQQLQQARHAKIKKIIPMREHLKSIGKQEAGTHPVFYVEFENGLAAVWKPEEKKGAVKGEAVAYQAARLIGLKNVPPAVVTELQGQTGVLSYYISSSIDIKAASKAKREEIFSKISPKEISDMHLFHFIFGNNDRHYGNIIIDDQYRIVLIDNESVKMLTQFNLNGVSYARRATLKEEFRSKEDELNETPFPFDRVRYLNMNNPAIIEGFLRNTDANLLVLQIQASNIENKMLPIILWRNIFWTPTRANHLPPFDFKTLSVATMSQLSKLTRAQVRAVFDEEHFSRLHIDLIMHRREQLLGISKTATLID